MSARAGRDPASSRSFALWFGVLAPPAAWGSHLVLGDLVYELGCQSGVRGQQIFGLGFHVWTLLQTTVLAAVTIVAGVLSYRALRELRRREDGASLERAGQMAWVGVASAAIYGLLILYGFVPPAFLDPCTPPL